MIKFVLPPFRFFAAWLSFGICVSTGLTCLFYLFGVGKTSDYSSAALQQLDYNPSDKESSTDHIKKSQAASVSFDLPVDCPNFADVVVSVATIKNTEAALRASLYSSGVHWATHHSHDSIGFPLYVVCLGFAFIAVASAIINCFWPPSDDMARPPGSGGHFKVRKIRMRVPQKNQHWSGYIYTHLYDEGSSQQGVCVNPAQNGGTKLEDETLFDRETLKFLQRTISSCGSREQTDGDEQIP